MKRNTLRFILRVSVLTFNKLKMKKLNLLTLALIGGIVFWSSCSKSSDSHDDGCHDCHIAQDDGNGGEIEFEIGEFCGSDLTDVEANGYHTTDVLYSESGLDTLQPGHYDEVHCEEHAH